MTFDSTLNDNSLSIEIRHATPEDAEQIAEVSVQSWRESYRGIVPDSYLDRMSVDERAERMRAQMLDVEKPAQTFVAIVAGRIVGFATGGRNRSESAPEAGELYALYSLREVQGQGVGRRLVRAVAEELAAWGFVEMRLWVLRDNPARGFYERLGATYLHDGSFIVDGVEIAEMAYGWSDLRVLLDRPS